MLEKKGLLNHFASIALALSLTLTSACQENVKNSNSTSKVSVGLDSEGSSSRAGKKNDVIAHMFNYPFKKIIAEIDSLKEAGYGYIQISPPQLSNGGPWWGRYQPLDYRVIDGPLGNEDDLRALVSAAKKAGIEVIADLVLNHMANLGGEHDLEFPSREVQEKYGLEPLFVASDFNPAYCITDWNDAEHVRKGRLCGGGGDTGLPDLDLANEKVLNSQLDYIAKLKDIGITGYRFDAVKHMELDYIRNLLEKANIDDSLIFGEIIAGQSKFKQDIEPYLSQTPMSLMDFPLHETLREVFSPYGSMTALENPEMSEKALSGERAVTFSINHDIPNNEGFRSWILDPTDEELAYTFILGRKHGTPQIFSDLGVADGLPEDRWKRAHAQDHLKRKILFRNEVSDEPMQIIWATQCHLVFTRGEAALVAINKCKSGTELAIDAKMKDGSYRNHLKSVAALEVSAGKIDLKLPGRSSAMFTLK